MARADSVRPAGGRIAGAARRRPPGGRSQYRDCQVRHAAVGPGPGLPSTSPGRPGTLRTTLGTVTLVQRPGAGGPRGAHAGPAPCQNVDVTVRYCNLLHPLLDKISFVR